MIQEMDFFGPDLVLHSPDILLFSRRERLAMVTESYAATWLYCFGRLSDTKALAALRVTCGDFAGCWWALAGLEDPVAVVDAALDTFMSDLDAVGASDEDPWFTTKLRAMLAGEAITPVVDGLRHILHAPGIEGVRAALDALHKATLVGGAAHVQGALTGLEEACQAAVQGGVAAHDLQVALALLSDLTGAPLVSVNPIDPPAVTE